MYSLFALASNIYKHTANTRKHIHTLIATARNVFSLMVALEHETSSETIHFTYRIGSEIALKFKEKVLKLNKLPQAHHMNIK